VLKARGAMARCSVIRTLFAATALVALFQLALAADHDENAGAILARMTPSTAEGWSLSYLNGLVPKFQLKADGSGIAATDTAATTSNWYFVAPSSFSGDMKGAYNGKLYFSIVHMEVADAKAKKDLKDPLVVLQAKCGHYLWWAPSKMETGTTSVMLNEDAGWKDSRTGKAAGVLDMLGVLSHLDHIKIRGGFFKTSAETTRLVSVRLVAGGRSWFPCCTLTNEVDMCAKKPTDWFSPSNLVFYCEGSLRKTIKVTNIYPRFARRTGGASITVEGQNFGLSGSQPIVRIGGRKCETTRFTASSHTGAAGREKLNNKNGNALLTAFDDATDSMKSMYPEHCWNGMKDDGTDTGFNYGTAANPKYINQGETGIDTGGPCFPSHCSSCPDDSKTWCSGGQIVAVSSGTCKGRGNQDIVCAPTFPYQHYPNMCPDNAETALTTTIISKISNTAVTSSTKRTHSPTLSASQRAFDMLDVRTTNTSLAVAAADTTITVSAPAALVCIDHNDASSWNCNASTGVTTDLVENYLKIIDINNAYKSTIEYNYEVVQVTKVSADTLTVRRAQGGTTAKAFPVGALVQMCGKHAHCLVNSDLKRGRFIKVNNEIMAVQGAGVIGHVSLSAASCGSGYNTSSRMIVQCDYPCNYTAPVQASITVSGGAITGVTITDGGSGFHPSFMPTITFEYGTGCTFTPWWSSVFVSRGAALTQAVAHSNVPVTVKRMDCIDSDETGDNCGGTCKPCPAAVMGPAQQDTLVCKAPEAVRGVSTRDLAVTVEATPGPKHSPYSVRMQAQLKGWQDASVAGVSCISEQSRGFAYGAHDFEWSSSLIASHGGVHTTSLSVDVNSGETYITGTFQGRVQIAGKHIMTEIQMGELKVTQMATPIVTCTGALNSAPTISGTGNNDCGRASFIARFSKEGKALYLNKLETDGVSNTKYQTVITDSAFDSSNSELYVVGYFNDGQRDSMEAMTLKAYDIDPTTRVSKSTASGSLLAQSVDSTNHLYQEGFLLKYNRKGNLVWMRSIKSQRLPLNSGLLISQLRIKTYKASTSSIINTARQGDDNAPTLPTHTSRKDIEFDTGIARGAVQGGTGKDSSITLKALASSTDHWYNGLEIRITRGAGYGQKRRIFEYDGATKIARVMPRWDPHDIPTGGSSYVIEGGRPSSWIAGTHWVNGGVYVTATVETVCGSDCHTAGNKTSTSIRVGEMSVVYRDSNTPATAKYVDVALGQDDHQNFLAQFDVEGKVYWARFVGVNGMAGSATNTTDTNTIIISGSYGEFGGQASNIDNFYVGSTITIIAGNNEGRSRLVTGYSASSRNITVDPPFSAGCDADTRFIISNRGTVATLDTAGTTTSVTLPHTLGLRSTLNGAFVGKSIVITKGTGVGQHATIQAYDGATRVATISTITTAAAVGSQVHIMDSSSIDGIAVMRDAVFLTGGVTTSGTRAQNCTFESATVTEGPPENTHPITVFECAVIGALPPVPSAARNPTWSNGAAKTEFAVAGSSSTDKSFGALQSSTTWGMFTVAYNGSGSLMWTHLTDGGAIFPKAILAMDPSIGGTPLAGKWGGTVDSRSLPSRSQPPDATSAHDVGSIGLDTSVVDGPYIYVAAEIADWINASDFGRTRLPLECSHGKTIGAKSAPTSRLADVACSGQVVTKGTYATWPKSSKRSTDIVLAQILATNGEVQQLRRTGQVDKSETVSSLAGHALTGAVYMAGEYYTSGASSSTQGNEASGAGEDVFGLASANREDSVGCPRQRWQGDLALGQAGVPDCRLYSNSPSATLPTGFVVKYNFKGDGATGSRKQEPSLTGYLEKSSTWAPCASGSATAETDGANHVLTGSSACSTHNSGCSCLSIKFQSRTFAAGSTDTDSTSSPYGVGPKSKLSGYRIRIVGGKSEGFEGIISSYNTALRLYNVIPSIPATGIDETSVFQLFPDSRHTPRLNLPNCDKVGDQGCSAYGVEWAKTVGYSIGGGASSSAQSSGVALVEMDSDIYVAGHYSGFGAGWPGYTGPSRNRAPAAGSPSFGVEGVDELVGFTSVGNVPGSGNANMVSSFLSKLTD